MFRSEDSQTAMPSSAKDSIHQVQVLHQSLGDERRRRALSLSSFYSKEDSTQEESHLEPHCPAGDKIGSISTPVHKLHVHDHTHKPKSKDYPLEVNGMRPMNRGGDRLNRSFRKKIRTVAKNEKPGNDSDLSEIEVPRSSVQPRGRERKSNLANLVSTVQETPQSLDTLSDQKEQLRVVQMRIWVAKEAMGLEPRLVDTVAQTIKKREDKRQKKTGESPGVFSLHVAQAMERQRTEQDRMNATNGVHCEPVTEEKMDRLVALARKDVDLTQHLLYTQKFDEKWRGRYTDVFLREEAIGGHKPKKPENRQGWVLPLKKMCAKVGVASNFFVGNKYVDLDNARGHILFTRLAGGQCISGWLYRHHPEAHSNDAMAEFLVDGLDPRAVKTRLSFVNEHIRADRHKQRVHGKYYNNVQLGKRMFGPARKQKTVSSIMGGMERRFEILDNQVNHIPFEHETCDRYPDKCRNENIHCRDSTRVVLRPQFDGETEDSIEDFIHANKITGSPLFNTFIITQAPMNNTMGDFWRMIWQERVPYIFMLISRKDQDRCAPYWPRSLGGAAVVVDGFRIVCEGVDSARDPLFRITFLRIVGPGGEERWLEHWQGAMNNSCNVQTPLNLLRLARQSQLPVVVHDCLGISVASCLVAAEIAICNLIRGPTYKYPVQKAVHLLRSFRPFSIETPMQYIFVHRVVDHFFRDISTGIRGIEEDYRSWLGDRARRMFLDDLDAPLPGYLLLSPKIDPDLLPLVRRPKRGNYRREAPDCVGEWPLPLDGAQEARRRLQL